MSGGTEVKPQDNNSQDRQHEIGNQHSNSQTRTLVSNFTKLLNDICLDSQLLLIMLNLATDGIMFK